MKKIILTAISIIILCTNIYGKEMWFVAMPAVDSTGNITDYNKYQRVNEVKVKFKIVEIIEDLLSKCWKI